MAHIEWGGPVMAYPTVAEVSIYRKPASQPPAGSPTGGESPPGKIKALITTIRETIGKPAAGPAEATAGSAEFGCA